MADPVSGELVIVPDVDELATITGDTYDWTGAVSFAAAYDDGTNSDYRLMTRAEALAIFENAELVSALELSIIDTFWTIEDAGANEGNAFVWAGTASQIYEDAKTSENYALPVRKVNFYGLPLIDSEFGGGLVFDVVAETRTVHVAAKPADFGGFEPRDWDTQFSFVPAIINAETFEEYPTRAQALKIFGNSYLVSLLGLPLDNDYWTSEEVDSLNAYIWAVNDSEIQAANKTNLHYALPIRSEVVPET